MDSKYETAYQYLSTPHGAFWKWDDEGKVIVWSDGSTLGFRDEFAAVVKRLAPRGLPPIDALMMFLAATRNGWYESSLPFRETLSAAEFRPFGVSASGGNAVDVFASLDRLHHWPPDIVRNIHEKAELAAVIFEAVNLVLTAEHATLALELLDLSELLTTDVYFQPSNSQAERRTQTVKSLMHDLWSLRNGLDGLTLEAYQLRRRTGLEDTVEKAAVEFRAEQQATQTLLQQLVTDEDLGGLARIARNLSAVVQLPRAIFDADDLQLGGVSDLSNRGTLDRLLLSELAHDDLMLATRLALNEALYLRREVPPSQPPQQGRLLIDCGLRMWGIPRVFSTGVALALAASRSPQSTWSAYSASGTAAVPVDLTTREGLVSHLETLEPELHPGRALAEFFALSEAAGESDMVLITTETVLKDPDFQKALDRADGRPIYLATVNRTGEFELWLRSERGRKSIASVRLNLDELLAPPAVSRLPLVDRLLASDLPEIFRVSPMPFRLPYQLTNKSSKELSWSVPLDAQVDGQIANERRGISLSQLAWKLGSRATISHGVMFLTKEGTLQLFNDRRRGALQLGESLPFGRLLYSGPCASTGETCAVIYRESERAVYLISVELDHHNWRVTKCESASLSPAASRSKVIAATVRATTLFVIYQGVVEAFSVTSGTMVGEAPIPEQATWVRGRFFLTAPQKWQTVYFDGSTVGFQEIPFGDSMKKNGSTLFDRSGCDGPFVVYFDGTVRNLADQSEETLMKVGSARVNVLDVDSRGQRLLITYVGPVASQNISSTTVVNLQKRELSGSPGRTSLVQVDAEQFASSRMTIHRLARVLVWDERLIVVTKNQSTWKLEVVHDELRLTQSALPSMALSQSFEHVHHSQIKIGLQRATWNDGSEIWIDARGLLHLKSSDGSIPEAAILLMEGTVAGWVSDGRMFGPDYFLDTDRERITPQEFERTILRPFVSRLK